jgi:hypothetical protein
VRYAESCTDKKLPPHPAYLQARRVLQSHAEALAGQSMVALAKAAASPMAATPVPGGIEPAAPASEPPVVLPPMRMAQQW